MVNKRRLFKILFDLLEINSPSSHEKGVADYIVRRLSELGIEAKTDDTSLLTGSDTGNVIARINGAIEGPSILFNAHMDTIQPTNKLKVVETEDKVGSSGDTILGADNKAGLAIVLELAHLLKENNTEHIPIEVVFTVSEEIGLTGANALDLAQVRSKIAFCFDGGGQAGLIIVKAPTQEIINVKFQGKAVHAGIEPEKGINAVFAAAKAAADFPQGRLDEGTTANIGIISGGSATNIVAEKASFKAEVRSHNPEKLQEVVQKIEKAVEAAAKQTGAKADIKRKVSFVGFRLEESEPVVRIVEKAISTVGLKPDFAVSGGGSDANIFNLRGIRTATLSTGAHMAHSNEEHIIKDEFLKTAELAVEIVKTATDYYKINN